MNEYERRLVTIGTWTGPAYRIDGVWHVRPHFIADALGISWPNQRQIVDERHPGAIIKIKSMDRTGGWRSVSVLPIDIAVQWLAAMTGRKHLNAEQQRMVNDMRAAIAAQYVAAMVMHDAPDAPAAYPLGGPSITTGRPRPGKRSLFDRLTAKLGGRHG